MAVFESPKDWIDAFNILGCLTIFYNYSLSALVIGYIVLLTTWIAFACMFRNMPSFVEGVISKTLDTTSLQVVANGATFLPVMVVLLVAFSVVFYGLFKIKKSFGSFENWSMRSFIMMVGKTRIPRCVFQ